MPIPDDEGRTEIPPRNTSDTELCYCGKPLHYTDPHIEAYVRATIEKFGPYLLTYYEGQGYLVPRHYIALHGLKGANLPSLGFETWP